MPWEIKTNVEGCDGFAVVKKGTMKVSGCHETREDAEEQLAALYTSEPSSVHASARAVPLTLENSTALFLLFDATPIPQEATISSGELSGDITLLSSFTYPGPDWEIAGEIVRSGDTLAFVTCTEEAQSIIASLLS